jgi:hypothetical protein
MDGARFDEIWMKPMRFDEIWSFDGWIPSQYIPILRIFESYCDWFLVQPIKTFHNRMWPRHGFLVVLVVAPLFFNIHNVNLYLKDKKYEKVSLINLILGICRRTSANSI